MPSEYQPSEQLEANGVDVGNEQAFDRSVKRSARLQSLVRLGEAGNDAIAALPSLRAVIADLHDDVLVRGYAAWAAEQIDPRHASEPGQIYYVAQQDPKADDSNPGTADLPWKTIQHAAKTLRPGDTVLIHSGIYREIARPFLGGTGYDRMITYRSAPGERPVITGADIWQPEWRSEEAGIWSAPYRRHRWDNLEAPNTPQDSPQVRCEQIIVDDMLLTHVESRARMADTPDTFFTDDSEGRLYVHLEEEGSPADHVVERSMREYAFAPAVRGLGYVRVQGLVMRYSAGLGMRAYPGAERNTLHYWGVAGHRGLLSVRAGHHWIIEDNVLEWGNAQGLDIGGEAWLGEHDPREQPIVDTTLGYHQVRRNRVNYNAVAGIVARGVGLGDLYTVPNHLLIEDNETNYNTQKRDFTAAECAGIKLHQAQDCIIRRHQSCGNSGYGIWFDWATKRNRITQCIILDNGLAGIIIEISPGPQLIDNNVIVGTRALAGTVWSDGIYMHDSSETRVVGNYVSDAAGFGVRVHNSPARNGAVHQPTSHHNRVFNNFLFDNKLGIICFAAENPRAMDNRSDSNIIYQHDCPLSAKLEGEQLDIKWEQTEIGRAMGLTGDQDIVMPLSIWQEIVGNDRHSLVSPPPGAFVDRTPEEILEALKRTWPKDAPTFDAGYGEVEMRSSEAILAEINGGS